MGAMLGTAMTKVGKAGGIKSILMSVLSKLKGERKHMRPVLFSLLSFGIPAYAMQYMLEKKSSDYEPWLTSMPGGERILLSFIDDALIPLHLLAQCVCGQPDAEAFGDLVQAICDMLHDYTVMCGGPDGTADLHRYDISVLVAHRHNVAACLQSLFRIAEVPLIKTKAADIMEFEEGEKALSLYMDVCLSISRPVDEKWRHAAIDIMQFTQDFCVNTEVALVQHHDDWSSILAASIYGDGGLAAPDSDTYNFAENAKDGEWRHSVLTKEAERRARRKSTKERRVKRGSRKNTRQTEVPVDTGSKNYRPTLSSLIDSCA